MTDRTDLSHHFLVAMPSLDGTAFERTVIYLVEDSPDGAMGLVINREAPHTVGEMLENVDIPVLRPDIRLDLPVHEGGPVDPDHGFVIHRPAGNWRSSILMPDDVAMTASLDLLEAMGRGEFPERFIMTLGYAGWAPGQLQQELAENSWLTVPYSTLIMFDIPNDEKWEMALGHLGVSPEFLSAEAGHA